MPLPAPARTLRPRQVWAAGVLVACAGLIAIVAVAADHVVLDAGPSNGDEAGAARRLAAAAAVAMVGLLVVGAAVIVWSLLGAPRGKRELKPRRNVVRSLLAMAVLAVVLMLVAHRAKQDGQAPPPTAPPAAVSLAPPAEPAGGSKPVWAVTALAVVVIGALMVASRLGRARGDDHGPLDDDGDRVGAPPVAAMADAFDASLDDLLAEPDPRRAVIGAYARLLGALERCGLGRAPSEAPEEHLRRALSAVTVRPAPLERLVALFAEARFSDHRLGPDERLAAIDAFRAARDDLRPHARMER